MCEWGAPLSAPGAFLQFGAGAPLAEMHYGAKYWQVLANTDKYWLLGAKFLKLNCVYIGFQPLSHIGYDWQN